MVDSLALIERLRRSQYGRHVALLASGTAIAQAISFAASPIMTRIYSPESYAVLALFVAISSSLSFGISGRYDLAAVVTRDPRESRTLVVLALWMAGVLSALALAGLAVGQRAFRDMLNADSLDAWLFVTPVALFLTAAGTSMRSLANRQGNYRDISRISIYQAILGVVLSLLLGVLGWEADGLITSGVAVLALGFIYLWYKHRSAFKEAEWRLSRGMWALALRYRDYPLISAPTSFLNGVMLGMPVFFLTKYFNETDVGHYALLTRVATAPLAFIAGAVSQVHLKAMAERVHFGTNASAYLWKITLIMIAIVTPPTILLIGTGPGLFAFVFGEEWRAAGRLLAILMPALALRFVVSPLSGALLATGHVKLGGVWQVLAFLASLAMYSVVAPRSSLNGIFVAMLINDLCLYAVYYLFIAYAVRYPKISEH